MWTSLLAALGIGTAVYGISKYRNGIYMRRIQGFIRNANIPGMDKMAGMFQNRNAFVEISEELMPKNVAVRQKRERGKLPINPA
jgi:hypothetical protein